MCNRLIHFIFSFSRMTEIITFNPFENYKHELVLELKKLMILNPLMSLSFYENVTFTEQPLLRAIR